MHMDIQLGQAQVLTQKQELRMTQELRMAIDLLALNDQDLLERINQEAAENVMLDFPKDQDQADPVAELKKIYQARRTPAKEDLAYQEEDELEFENFTSQEACLLDQVRVQFSCLPLNDEDRSLGLALLDSLDKRGYFAGDLEGLAQDWGVAPSRLRGLLKKIQTLDPPGLGSLDLKDCLKSQTTDPLLLRIIEDHLEDLGQNRVQAIAKALDLDLKTACQALDRIKALNPIPTSGYVTTQEAPPYIQPEIFIRVIDGEIQIDIPAHAKTHFHISGYYLDLLDKAQGELKDYLEKKARRAYFLREAILLRQENIEKVVRSLTKFQEGFFLSGQPLIPLTMQEVAEDCEISESTVSRVTDNKYLECCQGVYSLKDFFPTGLSSRSGQVSSNYIKDLVRDLIQAENPKKPLSDQKITQTLQDQEGIDIKRRTVAKYRQDLGIPSSSQRRQVL